MCLFLKETLLIVCNTACLAPVCLGAAIAKDLGEPYLEPGGLWASRTATASLQAWAQFFGAPG